MYQKIKHSNDQLVGLETHLPVSPSGRRYGWMHDKHDPRDLCYSVPAHLRGVVLPPSVDRATFLPPSYDQGQLGSCTGNALSGAHQHAQVVELLASFVDKDVTAPAVMAAAITQSWTPSRLMVYFNERVLENTVSQDAGAQIRDGAKTLAQIGVCPEPMWPYDIARFKMRPPPACFAEAGKHKAIEYYRVTQTLLDLKSCLAEGYPFVFGFTVYESFEGQDIARTGMMPMPDPSEQVLGGHAVLAVGYDDAKACFKVRNSWGPGWGDEGHFWMPYAFITDGDVADDFWTIRTVAQG